MADLMRVFGIALALVGTLAAHAGATHLEGRSTYHAVRAESPVRIDGTAAEEAWAKAEWRAMNYRWLGPEMESGDYAGRFKVVWTPSKLFIMAEIVDDILIDTHRDPLTQYWDDDCLEIFLDEDYSGGEHQHNHNAFAYHLSLDNRAIDIDSSGNARDYTDHVESVWRQTGDTIIWEAAFDIYDDSYDDASTTNEPVVLTAGKIIGLMVAYCDNDGSELRENFMGSESVPTGPKDRGWIDAGLFGKVILDE